MANSRILELSSSIARDTAIVEDCCRKHKMPSPSYDVNAPPTVRIPPTESAALEAQDNIIAATRELMNLMRGPHRIPTDLGYVDAFVLQAISRFQVAKHVPIEGEASFEEISRHCGMKESVLKRVLRFAMSNGYFCESQTKPGFVSHTSLSRMLADSEDYRAKFAFMIEEGFTASAKGTDALDQYPDSEEPTRSGWGLFNHARQPIYAELQQEYPLRHQNASIAMDSWNVTIPASPLVDNYTWADVDSMVDIGGGHGHVCLSIARQYSRPRFVVQDLANVVAGGPSHIPQEYQERISFMEHDMFQEQPVKDADVYFFRSIFHNWPDKYCIQMLKALIPAMKPGARVVVNDACLPPPGEFPASADRSKRLVDLNMMLLFNARDREEADWAELFQRADARFKFLGTRVPHLNVEKVPRTFLLSIIGAIWEP